MIRPRAPAVKRVILAVVVSFASTVTHAAWPEILIIGHRGASGHRPEHTIESYTLAIAMGADYIEPDLVSTKDGVLVARHENEIGGTTDVADRFPARKTTKTIDGQQVTGWFTEDFMLAEIRTLRAKERLPFRSHERDGMYPIPTFDEVVALADAKSKETGRTIGVYPETKHPSYFRSIGLPLEPPLLETLSRHGKRAKTDAVFIQSFEPANLRLLRPLTELRLVLLLDATADVSPARLADIRTFADGIGPNTRLIVPANADGTLREPTSLVADAHEAGLLVHVWTLRSEPAFLSPTYGGDPLEEYRQFAALGVDGIFGDFPDVAFAALRTR
jgi:glycerophosphoryl diester phosphodiesterase